MLIARALAWTNLDVVDDAANPAHPKGDLVCSKFATRALYDARERDHAVIDADLNDSLINARIPAELAHDVIAEFLIASHRGQMHSCYSSE